MRSLITSLARLEEPVTQDGLLLCGQDFLFDAPGVHGVSGELLGNVRSWRCGQAIPASHPVAALVHLLILRNAHGLYILGSAPASSNVGLEAVFSGSTVIHTWSRPWARTKGRIREQLWAA